MWKKLIQQKGIQIALVVMTIMVIATIVVHFQNLNTNKQLIKSIENSSKIQVSINNYTKNLVLLHHKIGTINLTSTEEDIENLKSYYLTKSNIVANINFLLQNEKALETVDNGELHENLINKLQNSEAAFESYFLKCDSMAKYIVENTDMGTVKDLIDYEKNTFAETTWSEFETLFDEYINQKIAQQKYNLQISNFFSTFLTLFLVFFGIPLFIILFIHRINEDKRRNNVITLLNENNKKYLFDDGEKFDISNPDNLIKNLIKTYQNAALFVKKMTIGDYSAEWEGLNESNNHLNNDTLAGEMSKMREQLKKIKQEDDSRNWTNEGLRNLAELLQKDLPIALLSDEILSWLIKYLGANQGIIFTLNDENPNNIYLEKASVFAYGKKKFVENLRISPGQGLVGQTFLEKETLNITNIPKNFQQITSGLGQANPSNLLIVPLISEDEAIGIIEIASFNLFEPYQIKFVEKAAESIGTVFFTLKNNYKTKKLLADAQEQSEELRSQEEEVRQNMEELLTTQEELTRIRRELERELKKSKSNENILKKSLEKSASKDLIILDLQKRLGIEN